MFLATSATYAGDPADADEAERIDWRTWDEVCDGLSLTGLLYRLAER